MFQRWVIRGLFISLLTLCVGVWGGSYFYGMLGVKRFANRQLVVCSVEGLGALDISSPTYPATTFDWERGATAKSWHIGDTYLGFNAYAMSGWLLIIVPLWLPTVVLLVLNWFVWRKTRLKAVGRAFPVELARP